MIEKIINKLCQFPHRLTTTENEKKASEILKAELEALGYKTTIEKFSSPRTFSWTYFVIYLGFFISFLSAIFFPAVGLVIFILALVIFFGEQSSVFAPLTRGLFAQAQSQNIIAEPEDEAPSPIRIWLVAHYDTSKTSLAFAPNTVRFLRPLFLVSLALLGLGLVMMVIELIFSGRSWLFPKIILSICAVYFLYMAVMMLERELRGVPVQGACDNASGVAVVMELAKRLAQSPLKNLNFRILLTGAEEVGLVGMANFLKKHKKELDPKRDFFINFDSIGEGEVCYITKEGMLFPLSASSLLLELAQEVSRDEKFAKVKPSPYTALTLDTLVARARGFPVISIMALTKDKIPKPWHWFDDTKDKVDINKLFLASDFVWEMLKRLAQKTRF